MANESTFQKAKTSSQNGKTKMKGSTCSEDGSWVAGAKLAAAEVVAADLGEELQLCAGWHRKEMADGCGGMMR